MSTKLKGIDVSEHNGNIDFAKLKNSVDYVIMRAGYGDTITYPSQIDKRFETNYAGCKKYGIPCGVYFYSYAKSIAAAEREAESCISLIKGKKFEYPIYFDLEEQSQFALGKAMCSNMVKAFCNKLEQAGYYAGLYISRSPLQQYISSDVANRYALWVAEYASQCNYSGTYGMWQYSSTGKPSGMGGNTDMDICYTDYPSAIKKAGLNGYTKQAVSTKLTLDTKGYTKGYKTSGSYALKCLLMLDGAKLDDNNVIGDGTVKAINSRLKAWGYAENGIAGDNFIRKLRQKIASK